MKDELVSVITPMYYGARFVGSTIESVLAQTYPHLEMIIIDDCSPDGGEGIAIVRKYQEKDERIKLIKLETNKGSSGARNIGILEAKGKYLCLLDSDDLWEPEFLQEQLQFMKLKRASLVYSSYKRIDEEGREILSPFIAREKVDYSELLKSNYIGCLTALYNTDVCGKFYLNEKLGSIRDDYEYWLRILKNLNVAYGNKQILASYRVMRSSTTGNKWKMIIPQWKVYRHVEKLSYLKSAYYLAHWAVSGIIKYSR